MHVIPPPDFLVREYEELRRWVNTQGQVTMPHPFPPDLRVEMPSFGRRRDLLGSRPSGTTLSAAEYGRHEQ